MGQVIWADSALDDLQRNLTYLGSQNPHAAVRIADEVKVATRRLVHLPLFGPRVPEFNNELIRELWVAPYRIIYITSGENSQIIAVIHSRRDLSRTINPADFLS